AAPAVVGRLKRAGAVLTDQGGVTAHAALICRELGIPTIIGIPGLLDRLHDGDLVEVDAERGVVTPLSARPAGPGPDLLGAKAFNLGVVRSLGFAVPDYVVLAPQEVRRAGKRFLDGVLARLHVAGDEKLAVRSSALHEDSEEGSQAGAYRSLLNVPGHQLSSALCEFFRCNGRRNGKAAYRG